MNDIIKRIYASYKKFKPVLTEKTVLTEAASGNYIVTPLLAGLAGAQVLAYGKDTKYGTTEECFHNINKYAELLGINNKISFLTELNKSDLVRVDILTNTGMLRPIDKTMISMLKNNCVIPLMWEPWEFRETELDIEACHQKGIKVYGTNESHSRLKTLSYLGYTALYLLLKKKLTPMSAKVLLIGSDAFSESISRILKKNNYRFTRISVEEKSNISIGNYNCIIIAEHSNSKKIIGINGLFNWEQISGSQYIVHFAGSIDMPSEKMNLYPENIAPFGYMSITTDYIDPTAVFDLHCAGLKVAEGMLKANDLGLKGQEYKNLIENSFYGKAFANERYW